MRRTFFRALTSLACAAILGCGGRQGDRTSAAGGTRAQVEIRIIGEPSPAFTALIDLKTDYASAAAVGIDITTLDRAALLNALTDRSQHHADLAVVPSEWLERLVAGDAIHRVKSFIDDLELFDPRIVDPQIDLLPWWSDASKYNRQIYGYPVTTATTFVIPARARHPREAFRVMQQVLSADTQEDLSRKGVISPRKGLVPRP